MALRRGDLKIGKLGLGDLEAVRVIVKGLPEWFTDRAIDQVVRDAAEYPGFVAVLDGRVVGFVVFEERECCVEILWLAVNRMYHGRGIGTALVEAVERYACSRGKNIVTVKTYGGGDYEPYRRTAAFYKARGFRLYEVLKEYEPFGGQPAAILIKTLDCEYTKPIMGLHES